MVALASLGHRPVLQMDEESRPGVTTGKWRSQGSTQAVCPLLGSVCITKVAISMLCNMHIELSGKWCAGMKGSCACPISHSSPSLWHQYCFLIVCQCFTFYSMHFTLDFYVIKGKVRTLDFGCVYVHLHLLCTAAAHATLVYLIFCIYSLTTCHWDRSVVSSCLEGETEARLG